MEIKIEMVDFCPSDPAISSKALIIYFTDNGNTDPPQSLCKYNRQHGIVLLKLYNNIKLVFIDGAQ